MNKTKEEELYELLEEEKNLRKLLIERTLMVSKLKLKAYLTRILKITRQMNNFMENIVLNLDKINNGSKVIVTALNDTNRTSSQNDYIELPMKYHKDFINMLVVITELISKIAENAQFHMDLKDEIMKLLEGLQDIQMHYQAHLVNLKINMNTVQDYINNVQELLNLMQNGTMMNDSADSSATKNLSGNLAETLDDLGCKIIESTLSENSGGNLETELGSKTIENSDHEKNFNLLICSSTPLQETKE